MLRFENRLIGNFPCRSVVSCLEVCGYYAAVGYSDGVVEIYERRGVSQHIFRNITSTKSRRGEENTFGTPLTSIRLYSRPVTALSFSHDVCNTYLARYGFVYKYIFITIFQNRNNTSLFSTTN